MKTRTTITMLALLLHLPFFSVEAQTGSLTLPPRDFVRGVIDHELKAQEEDHSHWRYLVHYEKPGESETREVIEAADGDVYIVLSRNGQTISPEEREKQSQRLKQIATESQELQNARAAKREDADKAKRLLRLLPDAFLFQYEQAEGDRRVLQFRPDPVFRPRSREETVFHNMAGTIVLDTKEQRLAAIQGQLLHEVKFGGGILGHIDKGGTFRVEQAEVAPGYWELTRLDVDVQGKALLFKTINRRQKQRRTNFRRVPDDLTLAQAADMLLQEENPSTAGKEFVIWKFVIGNLVNAGTQAED
jgi:hypothetical protein